VDKTLRGSDDALERGEETRQLDLSYRGGPLTLDHGCSAVLAAGDRAPDAPCQRGNGDPARLFTLFAGIGAISTDQAALGAYGHRLLPHGGSAHRDRKGGVTAKVAQ
jgi:hypothetical protein